HQGDSGEIKAVAYLAGRTFAFKERSIYVASGDGPDLTGNNDTFSTFEAFSLDVGLADTASLVTTTFGLIFKSHRGFYLLGRDGGLTYIGADIEDTALANTVVDAAFNQDAREVRFVCLANNVGMTLTMFETKDGSIDWRWSTDSYGTGLNCIAAVGGQFIGGFTGSGFFGILNAAPHWADLGQTISGATGVSAQAFPVTYET